MYLFLYVFYGLFHDTTSKSDNMESNDGKIGEQWTGHDVEGSGNGLIRGTIPN
jgi:hypothetical protein